MTITEHRIRELLNWLDDQAANHALPYQECARHRGAATLIRELRERLASLTEDAQQ